MDRRSKRQWGSRDALAYDLEEVQFHDERLVVHRETPQIQNCLQLSLWRSTVTKDTFVAALLVHLNDHKLWTTQTWLMRDRDVSCL